MSVIDRNLFIDFLYNQNFFDEWAQKIINAGSSKPETKARIQNELVSSRQIFTRDVNSENRITAAISIFNRFTSLLRRVTYNEQGVKFHYNKQVLRDVYRSYLTHNKKSIGCELDEIDAATNAQIHGDIKAALREIRVLCDHQSAESKNNTCSSNHGTKLFSSADKLPLAVAPSKNTSHVTKVKAIISLFIKKPKHDSSQPKHETQLTHRF